MDFTVGKTDTVKSIFSRKHHEKIYKYPVSTACSTQVRVKTDVVWTRSFCWFLYRHHSAEIVTQINRMKHAEICDKRSYCKVRALNTRASFNVYFYNPVEIFLRAL